MPFPSGVRHTHYPGTQVRVTQGFYETSMTPHKPFWFVPGVSLRCSGFSIPVMHLVDSGRGLLNSGSVFATRERALEPPRTPRNPQSLYFPPPKITREGFASACVIRH